jgi:hypothetical protein
VEECGGVWVTHSQKGRGWERGPRFECHLNVLRGGEKDVEIRNESY